jgi:serine/threonine protein kinase
MSKPPTADDATAAPAGEASGGVPLGPPERPDEIGRLGHYRVLKPLGRGGMGAVFHAEDSHLRRPVALKVMLPAFAADPAARERFLREARAAAVLKHDNVVTIYQVGEDRGVPFLAMEFLRGVPLDRWLDKHPRPTAPQVLRIGREVAAGLAAAHARGLMHRDIKPGNIWLEAPSGRAKILDFGLARSQADPQLTKSGLIIGTPAYMAPEQARGGPVDHRCDLWALGVVLYRLCTGRLPFDGTDMIATLTAIALDTPPPVRDLNPDVPPDLADLIERLLTKDPAGRPQSAEEVGQALKAVRRPPTPASEPTEATAVEREVEFVQVPSRTVRVPRRESGGRWVPPTLAAVAVVVLIAGFSVWPREKSTPTTPATPAAEPANGPPVVPPPPIPLPAPPAPPQARDLLPLIDPAVDAVKGHWIRRADGLVGRPEGKQVAKLQIPYRPPAEYDLRVDFTRTDGDRQVMIGLAHGDRSFRWTMDVGKGSFVFQNMNARPPSNLLPRLVNNRRYTTVVHVRNDGATADLDGRRIGEYRGDYSDIHNFPAYRLRDETLLGLMLQDGVTVFHAVEVTDVTGTGTVVKPPPAPPG